MNEKTLKELALKSMSAMLSVILFSAVFTRYNNVRIYANEDSQVYNRMVDSVSEAEMEQQINKLPDNVYVNMETGSIVNHIGDRYLVMKKPSEANAQVAFEDLYMTRQIRVTVSGLEEQTITKRDVTFEGTAKEGDPLLSVAVSYEYNPTAFLYTAVMDIQLDDIYAHQIYEDKQNIYIGLLKPHDVYEKIIVLDAGHGGNDIGAYTKDMEYLEKDINLKILLHLKEMLEQEDIKVYYTRLDDEKVYLNPRLDLANDLKADMFISIHCNSCEYPKAQGSEVLYSTKHQENQPIKSEKLAAIFLEELVNASGMRQRGIVNGNDIYIVGNAKVPVALIETGFISNKEDLRFLIEEENQKLIANGIYNGILKAYDELEDLGD